MVQHGAAARECNDLCIWNAGYGLVVGNETDVLPPGPKPRAL